MWFLPVLFLVSVGYKVLDHTIVNKKALSGLIIAISIFGFVIPEITTRRALLGIDTAMVAILFYHTGREMKFHGFLPFIDNILIRKQWLGLLINFLIFIGNAALVMFNPQINMRTANWGIPPLTYENATITTSLCLYYLWKLAVSGRYNSSRIVKWMRNISITSIIYLCTNHVAIMISRFAINLLFEKFGILEESIGTILTFLLCMTLMYLFAEIIWNTPFKVAFGRVRKP